jgi:hypothetical protein
MTTTDSSTPSTTTPREPSAGPDTGLEAEHQEAAPNREAARYRTRLRETEAERDAIAVRLAAHQRREAERIAGASLSKPSDVWLDGADLAELLDDQGDVTLPWCSLPSKAC